MQEQICLFCAGDAVDVKCNVNQCQGVFHTKCIKTWQDLNPVGAQKCPLCRNKLELEKIGSERCPYCSWEVSSCIPICCRCTVCGCGSKSEQTEPIGTCEYINLVIVDMYYKHLCIASVCYWMWLIIILLCMFCGVGILWTLLHGGCISRCNDYGKKIPNWIFAGFMMSMLVICCLTNCYNCIKNCYNSLHQRPLPCYECCSYYYRILKKCQGTRVHVQVNI